MNTTIEKKQTQQPAQPKTIFVRKFDNFEWEEIPYKEFLEAVNLAYPRLAFAETKPAEISFFEKVEQVGDSLADLLTIFADQNGLHTGLTSSHILEEDTGASFTFHVYIGNVIAYSVPVSDEWAFESCRK